jgi:2-C-methyl-D-erythritol 2,4-cyclodiphosphate synthase
MIRVGIGYDSHRLVPDRPLILGGQPIPFDLGLAGHSDADAVAHALTDALLGAAALGDIGKHFPDTDPRFKGADSLALLRQTAAMLREHGFTPQQADITVILEKPKLGPFFPAMGQALSAASGIPVNSLGLKAKTNEGMGFVGKGEGVAVIAVATISSA